MRPFMIDKRESLSLTEKEIALREEKHIPLDAPLTQMEMARRCDCGKRILEMLESGEWPCTHPAIAARIAKEYGLTVEEYNQIVHESHHVTKLPKPTPKPKSNGIYDAWRDGWNGKEGLK